MASYNYWSQNPQVQQYQSVSQSPVYFRDQTNTQYGSYNGQPFAMFAPSTATITTPSPSVTSNSSFSSGYGSELSSPMPMYQTTTPYSVSSQWYQQPQAAKKVKHSPDTENIIRQIFQTPEPVAPQPTKQPKVKKTNAAKKPKTTATNPTINTTEFELDNLDDIDCYENFDLDEEFDGDDDDNNSNNDSLQHAGKKRRVLTKSQRLAANVRERKRMNIMNEAFMNLKQALPHKTGRKRRKMSRLDIVCGALEYIAYLDDKLSSTTGPIELNFEAYQNSLDFF